MRNLEKSTDYKGNKIIRAIKSPIYEFFSFDKEVIKYMAMHWIGGALLIYASLVPVLMNKMGINIMNAGIIFSVAAIFDVVFTYLLRKVFDRISPNTGMTLDWLTESLPAIIYGLASTSFHFLLGGLAQKITNVLNPIYMVYENEIFPEDKRTLIYTYHLMTPEIFTIILYPLIGYLLTYRFTDIRALRIVFLICGVGYLFVALIPYKGLKRVEPADISVKKTSIDIPKNLYLGAGAHILIMIGGGLTSTLLTSYYILDSMNGTIMDILMLEVVGAVIIVVTGLFTKNLNKHISEEKIAQYGIAFFIIFAILMVAAKSYIIILIAFMFQAIGSTVWYPSHNSILMKYVPKEKRGEFFGSMSSIRKFISMILPILSGVLAKSFGFLFPFGLALMAFVAACIVYQKLIKSV